MTSKQRHRYLIKKVAEFTAGRFDNGYFAEFGVKQGTSSAIMAKVLQRKGYLFDTWHGFPSFTEEDAFNKARLKKLKFRVKTGKNTEKECINNLKKNKVFELCEMVKGDINKTVPAFFKSYEGTKFCMVHIDTDLYEPARTSLEYCWPHVMKNGLVAFHDYGDSKWPGIKKLVQGFLADHESSLYDKFDIPFAIVAKSLNYDFSGLRYD